MAPAKTVTHPDVAEPGEAGPTLRRRPKSVAIASVEGFDGQDAEGTQLIRYFPMRYYGTLTFAMQDTLRIIDANFNRAREALRVMEDYARFCLNDAALTQQCKDMRHKLGNLVCALELRIEAGGVVLGDRVSLQAKVCGSGKTVSSQAKSRGARGGDALVTSRDTPGDVGTKITTETEGTRNDTVHVALASAKRLTEALRVIEEYGKLVDQAVARRFEKTRYDAYELEKRLTLCASARARFGDVRLYVLITEALCQRDWFETAQAVLDNGADCIQLREKPLSDAELLDRAEKLTQLCNERSRMLIINNRPDIAAACGAHGVHVGQDDLNVRSARRVLPTGTIVGVSTHTIEQVESTIGDSPDYVAVGPMFPSETKPQDHIAGPEALAAARSKTGIPLVAIGGIDVTRSIQVVTETPCTICICSAIISQADPGGATQKIRTAIDEAWERRQNG